MKAPPRRALTHVAVGVLIRSDRHVLLADRPQGKPYAGYWEFPGGKIEEGEHVGRALERELHEELGIEIEGSVPWVTFEYDYPHALVELQFRVVHRWRGEPHPREGQRLRFVDPAGELPRPLLPAAVPALRWLLLPTSLLAHERPAASTGGRPSAAETASPEAATRLIVDSGCSRVDDRSLVAPGSAMIREGTGRIEATSAAGVIGEPAEPAGSGSVGARWKGAWADSEHDLQRASREGGDFVLVRTTALAERLRISPGPLPAYVPAAAARDSQQRDGGSLLRCWVELHRTARDAAD